MTSNTGEADEQRNIDRFEDGITWIAYPEETMQRASHAVVGDNGGVWVIDPVDMEGLDEVLAEFGEVAGVVVLLDRHNRDCAKVATRHDVSVWVPSFMNDVAEDLDASIRRFTGTLDQSGFVLHELINNTLWQEGILYNERSGILVVPEAIGSAAYFKTGERELGVHPMLRVLPPRELLRFEPTRILVGHGHDIADRSNAALVDAMASARIRTPRLVFETLKNFVSG